MMSISSLPPELLSEIFQFCHTIAFLTDSEFSFCEPNVSTSPLLLTQICSRWRHVAIHTPQLWSSLSLKWDTPNLTKTSEICKVWLGRSGDYPLSLSFEDMHERYRRCGILIRQDACITTAILQTILPFKCRWKRLSLVLNYDVSLPLLSELFRSPDCPSILEVLSLDGASWSSKQLDFGHLTNLRCLRLLSRARLSVQNFPSTSLTHLVVDAEWTTFEALDVLQTCSKLTDATLYVYHSESSRIYRAVTAPFLRNLDLKYESETTYDFIDALTLPQLVSLIYEEIQLVEDHPFSSISSMLTRSGRPALETFHITILEGEVDEADVINLLRLTPRLKSFEITLKPFQFSMHGPENGLILFGDELAQGIANSTLAPALMRIGIGTPWCVREETLMNVITSRSDLEVYIALGEDTTTSKFLAFLDKRQAQVKYELCRR